ncbi:MAG: cell division protein FtsQ/DivIB [Pseudomonadota bacterium]
MPPVNSTRRRRRAQPPPPPPPPKPSLSSIAFGIGMVVAIIVAGAALFGGSLSKAEQRWASALDGTARSVGLAVEGVEVIGLEHMPELARQVRDAAMIVPGENMFRADPYLIQHRIERTRLVANVRVYRLWPDTVMIRADAAKPTAHWFDGDTWQLVDSFGRTLPQDDQFDTTGLLQTQGDGAAQAVPALHQALFDHPQLRAQFAVVERVGSRRWDVRLQDGATVILPEDPRLPFALTQLAALLASGPAALTEINRIDLRLPDRPTLKLQKNNKKEAA